MTPWRILGWRSSFSLPVPPSVTPCRIETSSSITAVSPHKAGGVIEENPAADPGGGIDVGLETAEERLWNTQLLAAFLIEPVRQAMGLQGMEALEESSGSMRRRSGGSRSRPPPTGAEGVAEIGLVAQRFVTGSAGSARQRQYSPLGDAMHHRGLQPVVMQHGGIDKACEFGLAAERCLPPRCGIRSQIGSSDASRSQHRRYALMRGSRKFTDPGPLYDRRLGASPLQAVGQARVLLIATFSIQFTAPPPAPPEWRYASLPWSPSRHANAFHREADVAGWISSTDPPSRCAQPQPAVQISV